MPHTINGVGTHYYGKANLQQRAGVCRNCHRQVNLSSYDTRLWFVVFFIPVIPLGRKHIIDACPTCRRHFVAEMEKWEMARQLETSGALEKFRSDPTPDNAIAAHQQLVGFHQIAEAGELQRTMQEEYGDNARVQVYLAGALQQLGQTAEADTLFRRALELRADLPRARVGVAEGHMRAGRFDEARKLLDFLEKPGAAQLYSLAPLERLALACQKAGRHDAALEIFTRILEGLPAIAQNSAFRKEVKQSEGALGRSTILPRAKFSIRRFFILTRMPGAARPSFGASGLQAALVLGVLAGLVLGAIAIADAYIGHHRTLYIVNGTGTTLRAEISGLGRIHVPMGVTSVVLSEGHYTARFDPPVAKDVTFDIHTEFFGRWLGRPVWVLNPGGEGIILSQRIFYAKQPVPGTFTCEYGRPFKSFPAMDFPFKAPPAKLQVSAGSTVTVKTALDFYGGEPINVFSTLIQDKRRNEALPLAEWRLSGHPDDKPMLTAYVRECNAGGDALRLKRFLRGRLDRRPIVVEWHRAYQNLEMETNRSGLVDEYDRMLAAEPTNSALLYLRGRLCDDFAEGEDYFNRSLRANPDNPYPAFALAFDATSRADWISAKDLLDRAIREQPDNVEFLALWSMACLGAHEPALVEAAWRARLKKIPIEFQAELNVCQALLIENREDEVRAAVTDYKAAAAHFGKAGQPLANALDYEVWYMKGDFSTLEAKAALDLSPAGRSRLFAALIEENRPEAAAQVFPIGDARVKDPFQPLAMSVGWRLAGNTAEAAQWRDLACALLRAAGVHYEKAADLLTGKIEPTAANIDTLAMTAQSKALLLAALALSHPEQRDELAAAARRLNVERMFPYYLVQRATEARP